MKHSPRVSLILPVFNGENYLEEAIKSVLAQTYTDFELLISDNASTDRTEVICKEYVKKDVRIQYYRNSINIGAARNFNILFNKCRGKYFQWIAHDDMYEPQFLEKCVDVLDSIPDTVLCYSKVKVVDEKGRFIRNYEFNLNGQAKFVHQRFRSQIRGHQCYEIFGLIRKKALEKTTLIGNYAAGDAVLLIRLCLQGKFYEIPERLFMSRQHLKQSTVMQRNLRAFAIWFDPKNKQKINFPYWRIFIEYMKSVKQADINIQERLICFFWVGAWWVRRTRLLLKDILIAVVAVLTLAVKRLFAKLRKRKKTCKQNNSA